MSGKKLVKIIRIDPTTRAIAQITMPVTKRPTDMHAKRVCRAEKVGMREILATDSGITLCMFAGLDLEPPMDQWGFPGTDDALGIGFLAGKGPKGGLHDCPVDIEWVRKRIRFSRLEAEDDQRENRCRVCETPIDTAELCAKCAEGNDPFDQSKYGESRVG